MDTPATTTDHDSIVRIETKMDVFIAAQNDHEVRLRVLEKANQEDTGAKDTQRNSKAVIIAEIAAGAGLLTALASLLIVLNK